MKELKATELRIGNIVWACRDAAKILTIEKEVCLVEFLVYKSEGLQIVDIAYEDLEWITLTEEWLLKLGLKKSSYFTTGGKSEYEFGRLTLFVDGFSVGTNEFDAVDCVEYVHQLQNLFFALTGQELTITNTEIKG